MGRQVVRRCEGVLASCQQQSARSDTQLLHLQGLAIIGVGQILQFAAHKHLAGMARTAAQDKKAAAPRYTMPSGARDPAY